MSDPKAAFYAYEILKSGYERLVSLHDPEVVRKQACPDLIEAKRAVDEAYRAWGDAEDAGTAWV